MFLNSFFICCSSLWPFLETLNGWVFFFLRNDFHWGAGQQSSSYYHTRSQPPFVLHHGGEGSRVLGLYICRLISPSQLWSRYYRSYVCRKWYWVPESFSNLFKVKQQKVAMIWFRSGSNYLHSSRTWISPSSICYTDTFKNQNSWDSYIPVAVTMFSLGNTSSEYFTIILWEVLFCFLMAWATFPQKICVTRGLLRFLYF